jgi:hypothetical protein
MRQDILVRQPRDWQEIPCVKSLAAVDESLSAEKFRVRGFARAKAGAEQAIDVE